jgi:hypothetical protein
MKRCDRTGSRPMLGHHPPLPSTQNVQFDITVPIRLSGVHALTLLSSNQRPYQDLSNEDPFSLQESDCAPQGAIEVEQRPVAQNPHLYPVAYRIRYGGGTRFWRQAQHH